MTATRNPLLAVLAAAVDPAARVSAPGDGATSGLLVGTVVTTTPQVRVDVAGATATTLQYAATERAVGYTPAVSDVVLLAVVGPRVVIVTRIQSA